MDSGANETMIPTEWAKERSCLMFQVDQWYYIKFANGTSSRTRTVVKFGNANALVVDGLSEPLLAIKTLLSNDNTVHFQG